MSLPVEILEAEVLQLPPADRARLVESLIASLDADPAVEEVWAVEVERRLIEIESGKVGLVLSSKALIKLKAERQPGALKGELQIADHFDAPLPNEIQSAFEGE